MPSNALNDWTTTRAAVLDQFEDTHSSLGGTGPGRRTTTQHINQAYAVLLSAHFQGFCLDLHDECAELLTQVISPASIQFSMRGVLVLNRKLDTGNPNPGNIGSDFNRFGLSFWTKVRRHDARNEDRQERLEELNDWRNAIAHQDIDPAALGTATLPLREVRAWRQACHHLAVSFDQVMRAHILSLLGVSPWP